LLHNDLVGYICKLFIIFYFCHIKQWDENNNVIWSLIFNQLKKPMFQGIMSRHSLCWILSYQILYKIDCFRWHWFRISYALGFNIQYFFNRLFSAHVIERGLTCQEFISHHTQAPQIYTHVIFLSFQYLRSRVI